MRNCYYKRSKLSALRFRQIRHYFCLNLTASDAVRLSGVSVRSINEIYLLLRERLARECEQRRPFKGGEVEIDESCFCPKALAHQWITDVDGGPREAGHKWIARF